VVGSETSMILTASGFGLVIAATAWRQTARRRRFRRLDTELDADDATRRTAAGELAVSYGLGPAARCLLPRVEHEHDTAVRSAIALAVAHRQWEPAGSRRVLALRMWAAAELETQGYAVEVFGPAFTRISDMGGPQRPPLPSAVPAADDADTTSAASDDDKARAT
jgi:hypothetical protein